MGLIEQTIFLGHDIALLLPDPNWSPQKLEIVHRLTVDVDAGQTGREDRTPRHLVLRHEYTAAWTLSPAETFALQGVLAQLGTSYIGVPIAFDRLAPAQWALHRVYDASWVVEYDETGYLLHAADALPPAPSKKWFAPLLIGRRKTLPRLTPNAQGGATFKLTLLERSPWDFRIGPAPEGEVSADWPEALEANWRELPEDWTEDIVEYTDVGDGRVEAVQGEEGVTRRAQTMLVTCKNRKQIRTLLNFFNARKGRLQSFNAPWCLRPGADTPATPYATKARFLESELRLTFGANHADAKISFIQVPWESAGVDGEEPEQAPPAFYYKFKMDVPGGPLVWRFTSWEQSLQRNEDGAAVSYLGDTSGLFEHDQVTSTIDLQDESTTIGSWIFAANPLVRVTQRLLDVPLEVEIYRGDPATPAIVELIYQGAVADVKNVGRKLSATTLILGGALDIKVPNFFFGPICNHEFCGPGCNDGGTMPPENWTFTALAVGQAGSVVTLDIATNPPGADLVDDYFAKAWIEKGAGESYELRHVVRSTRVLGARHTFALKRPFRALAAGDLLTFRAYCSGTRGECENKFGNYPNMGAHPHIGDQNLSIPQRDATSASSAK